MYRRLSALCLAFLLIAGPAYSALTSMREPLFGTTDGARERADGADAALLAPINYAEAIDHYERADDLFKRAGSVDSIRRYLVKAEARFNKAAEAAGIARTAFSRTIEAREDALASEAPRFAERDWRDGEEAFSEATRRLERGSLKAAERSADKAETAFRAGELAAIKANYLNETKGLIKEAQALRADRYAPVSLNNARILLETAENELNGDRYDTDKPRSLALDAKHNALHAIYVAKLEQKIRDKETSLESILLAWEASISRLGDALDLPVYFDDGEVQAIEQLLLAIEHQNKQQRVTRQDLEDQAQQVAALNTQIEKMQKLLGGGSQTIEELENLLEQQARHRERFATVESLFPVDQATVLRQGDTVIIRMIGLNFDSGAAELKEEHLPLLAVLQNAISEFPESQVVVEGHTDAFGSDQQNLSLSQNRADAVVRHLLGTLPISPANLSAMGFGETRPVANNETEEGRKRNRRIDVVIQPVWAEDTVARVSAPNIVLNR